jgi:glycosyltransferase involved in cell wall biosynthesis
MISVIVPNYNHAKFLKERIDSILNQTIQDFELIILDDCSTDNSREIIESYRQLPNVSIFYNSKNSGSPFKQWKKGINRAKGKYIWSPVRNGVGSIWR